MHDSQAKKSRFGIDCKYCVTTCDDAKASGRRGVDKLLLPWLPLISIVAGCSNKLRFTNDVDRSSSPGVCSDCVRASCYQKPVGSCVRAQRGREWIVQLTVGFEVSEERDTLVLLLV